MCLAANSLENEVFSGGSDFIRILGGA
jgi:hypothetical protein